MIQDDKLLHRDISHELTLFLSFIIGYLWAMLVVFVIGVTKELIWNIVWEKEFSLPDIKANIYGIVCGVINFALISYLISVF